MEEQEEKNMESFEGETVRAYTHNVCIAKNNLTLRIDKLTTQEDRIADN